MLFDICDSGAELKLWLRLDRRLLVDRSEGSLLDLTEERRSGTITTGMPPFLQISRLAFPLDTEADVPDDAILSCRTPFGLALGLRRWLVSSCRDVDAELGGERSDPESRRVVCFFTWRSVFCRRGGVSTKMASTTVETVDLEDMPENRRTSGVAGESEEDGSGAAGLGRLGLSLGEGNARIRSGRAMERRALVALVGETVTSSITSFRGFPLT